MNTTPILLVEDAIRKEVRTKIFRSMVRMTTIDIHRAGEYPGQHRVRAALPEFIDMRDPVAHQEWKRTLVELGVGSEAPSHCGA